MVTPITYGITLGEAILETIYGDWTKRSLKDSIAIIESFKEQS